ncbi:assimilatory sulfite reductase (NADPH) flavoprotein subunit [Coraliomargarita akajimensis]|uniref:assimilatory sulfite reductase (NADPH) n=1 Tax=Coraliomargarita akajimensis (strain DSM 45221 / IAM 15411 / JCM 23193 / KCTC 12865 / 04OKA010-24) TaxID=583355 RepID=D5ENY9_CORAD|nr:assimilatory sulfite reductase (NADPH) flavoprotein subunit [Coraliomargarita akajimensis]ADE53648.1 sulfite reductase (NADPH) flavoprotein, alpha chain [Coraliomargarita akajimensis DSM 45221]
MSNSNYLPATSPLTPEQQQGLNQVLPTLQPDQILWLEGFISGLRAGTSGSAAPVAAAPVAKPELTVLFGSESGNAESLADQTAKAVAKKGFKTKVISMGDISPAKLKGVKNLLVLVSTWGEGDPPESCVDFYKDFMGDAAPRLEGTNFAVLGLGDTSYEHFCKMGKDFDARLEALGAKRIADRADCDVDYDDSYAAWSNAVFAELEKQTQAAVAPAPVAAAVATPAVKYSRKNPFPAELKERVQLNGRGSAKETVHLEFDLAGSGMSYEAGDALAVLPQNSADLVQSILDKTGFSADETISLKDAEYKLYDALRSQLDITALSKPVLTRYNELAQSAELSAILESKEKLNEYVYGRDLLDVISDFPAKDLSAQSLCAALRKLPPRLYSIASSPKAHEDEVHLTIGVVRYESQGREREGVCSTFSAERLSVGDTAQVFVTPNKSFKLPADPSTPVIMVGPGTGIAPFRAFIEERNAIEAAGKSWLFFGDQHYLTDFLYQTELQDYLKEGSLTKLDLAFSRDQAHKVYVQDRMLENSSELYQWLQDGAHFYVCGDASRMANDVDKALHSIIVKEGGLSEEEAAAYVKNLKSEKRYLRDVY